MPETLYPNDQEKQPIYDDQGSHDNLGTPKEQKEAFDQDFENRVNDHDYEGNPLDEENLRSAEEGDRNYGPDSGLSETGANSLRDVNQKERERLGLNNEDSEPDEIPYRPEGNKIKRGLTFLQTKSNNLAEKGGRFRRGALIGGGIGVVLIGVILIGISLLGSFQVIHIAENVTIYNMSRSARSFRESVSAATTESVAAETMTQSRYELWKARFGETRVAQAFDRFTTRWSTNKMLKNLNSNTELVYRDTGVARRFLPGNVMEFEGYRVNGTLIKPDNTSWFKVSSLKDIRGTAATIRENNLRAGAALEAMIERQYGDVNRFLRNRVMKKQYDQYGIKRYRFARRGEDFKNLKQVEAEKQLIQQGLEEYHADLEANIRRMQCASAEVCNSVSQVDDALKDTIDDMADLDPTTYVAEAEETLTQEVAETVERSAATNAVKSAVQNLSTINAFALPLCLIYEGSITNAKDTIDGKQQALEKIFWAFLSSADQQKYGDKPAEALGAEVSPVVIGNANESIPMQRASHPEIDSAALTDPIEQPQASALGDYSVFDAILGNQFFNLPHNLIRPANDIAKKGCGILTNPTVQAAAFAGELAALVASLGGSEGFLASLRGGTESFTQVLKRKLVQRALDRGLAEAGEKNLANLAAREVGSFIAKTGIMAGKVIGATELAKFAVMARLHADLGPMQLGSRQVDMVDMGGNLAGNETCRRTQYCRPITCNELRATNEVDTAYRKQVHEMKGFNERYFAMSDPSSLVTRSAYMASSVLSKPLNIGRSLVSGVSRVGPAFTKTFGALVGHKALAATSCTGAGDYNIVQWGWSVSEDALAKTEEYAPMYNMMMVESDTSGDYDDIEELYGKCFTDSMGTLLSDGFIKRNDDGSLIEDTGHDEDCSPKNLGIDNPRFGDKIFRWRIFKRNESTLDYMGDLSNPAPAPNSAF